MESNKNTFTIVLVVIAIVLIVIGQVWDKIKFNEILSVLDEPHTVLMCNTNKGYLEIDKNQITDIFTDETGITHYTFKNGYSSQCELIKK